MQVAGVLGRVVERVWGDAAYGSVLDVDPLTSWGSEAVTSADGVHWVKHGAVRGLRGPDAGELGPSVYFDGLEYLIFYNSVDPAAQEWKVYAATSRDGQAWTPANDGQPLVGDAPAGTFAEAGPGRNSAVHLSELVQVGGDLLAYYTGEDRQSVMRIGLLRFKDVTPVVCTYSIAPSSISVTAALTTITSRTSSATTTRTVEPPCGT